MLIEKIFRKTTIDRLPNGQLLRRRKTKYWWIFARQSQIKYTAILTKAKANNSFSIIFRGEYQGLQQIGLTY